MSNNKENNKKLTAALGDFVDACGSPKEIIDSLSAALLATISAMTEDSDKRMALAAYVASSLVANMNANKELKHENLKAENVNN